MANVLDALGIELRRYDGTSSHAHALADVCGNGHGDGV
jgi:hypothetical protein